MVIETVRGYAQLASGLGDVTRQRASQVARQIVEQGGVVVSGVASSAGSADVAKQVQGLAEDLLATARTNRDLLIGLIRTEVERTVNRMGLVGADELNAMARVVERLQSQLDAAIAFGGRATTTKRSGGTAPADGGSAAGRPVRRAPVTFAGAPAAEPSKAAAKKTTAKKSATKKTATKKTATKKAATKKSASKSATRKTAKRVPAKKTAMPTAPAPAGASAPSAPPPPTGPRTSTDVHGTAAVGTPDERGDQP
jgi:hypothetical protein